ncbi:hypothetical protein ABZ154_22650 [Streptomyces sp. NPDC006261]|uniref:hypothetical protein n=1 Tax=Streptomyces sp. NPDC006261 TaxID=3156739 RepID=UPI0033ACB1BE
MRPGPAHRTRSVLAALVLAVLTLVGGAPTAGAALPAGALSSRASTVAYTPNAPPPAPRTDRTAHPGGPHHDLRRTRTAPIAAGPGAGGRNARDQQPRPHRHTARPSPVRPHTHTPHSLHERSPAADPTTQTPRAAISRAHLSGHAPPPSYEGLLPCPPGPVVPRGHVERVTAAFFSTPSGRRGALPGVRGPPGTSAGPPTGHRLCSADPASRPR